MINHENNRLQCRERTLAKRTLDVYHMHVYDTDMEGYQAVFVGVLHHLNYIF